MSRYIGISINDELTRIAVDSETIQRSVPTVIARDKKEDRWTIGEEAYRETLDGNGIIVDKLATLLHREGTATIGQVKYKAEDILAHFFHELLTETVGSAALSQAVVVVAIRKPEKAMMDSLRNALVMAGLNNENITIISYMEAFAHFLLKQDKTLSNRLVGMFELSNQCLNYYELRVSRGTRRFAIVGMEEEEEAFSLDVLKTTSGCKIADRILRAVAERTLGKQAYSAVFLSGKGFEDTDFAPDFMNLICQKRRVLAEPGLFAIGAAIYAELLAEGQEEEYTILCDTRVGADVTIKVDFHEKEQQLPVVSAGEDWLTAGCVYDVILDNQNYIDFQVVSMMNPQKVVRLRMMLEDFPQRENRTTRVRISTHFTAAERLQVAVRDMGFGDLFPGSGITVTEEIDLTERI